MRYHIYNLLNGWKTKKSAINPTNNEDKCFQYAVAVALNHKLKTNQKGYQKLNIYSATGKKLIFHHIKKTVKSLHQIINQLLLIVYICLTILKK